MLPRTVQAARMPYEAQGRSGEYRRGLKAEAVDQSFTIILLAMALCTASVVGLVMSLIYYD
jgi:hypothetical protein